MNRYSYPIPRSIFGFAAIALMAGTFGLAVVTPAKLGSGGSTVLAAAASAPGAKQPTEIALSPSRIEVVGIREQTAANGQPVPPKKKHEAS